MVNPLSKFIVGKLAERRGLRLVSIQEKLVVVAPADEGSPDAANETAVDALRDELNRGAKNADIVVQLQSVDNRN